MHSEIAREAEQESIPTNWRWQQLSEVAHIIMGQSPPSSTYNDEGLGLPFFQGRTEFGSRYPTAVKWCEAPRKTTELGDVLISVRAPVGDVNLAPYKCCIGRGLAAIRAKENSSNLFLYYLLIYAKERLERRETGATFGNVSKSILETLKSSSRLSTSSAKSPPFSPPTTTSLRTTIGASSCWRAPPRISTASGLCIFVFPGMKMLKWWTAGVITGRFRGGGR